MTDNTTTPPVLVMGTDGVFQVPESQALKDSALLPVNLIQPSTTNRNRFSRVPKQALDDLTANIQAMGGVMQPIVVRPINAPAGQPQYEIVCGECRWYCTRAAGLPAIPVRIRLLDDLQARQLQVYENLHRVNPHPLDEAESFEALLKAPPNAPEKAAGLSIADLMKETGKSRSYIYQRLQMLRLVPQVVDIFLARKLDASVVNLVARMPQERQLEAAKRMLAGWGGAPMTFVQAKDYVEREHMTSMKKAPFPIKDESLVPKAGACTACPKRTGVNPDLFADMNKSDMCTDPKCYNAKRDAHTARLAQQAKEQGVEVITGKAALKILPDSYSAPNGYVKLEEPDRRIDSVKPLSKLLGKHTLEKVLVEHPTTHVLVPMVKQDAAMKALKDKGLVRSTILGKSSASDRKEEATRKADQAWRTETARILAERVQERGGFDDEEVAKSLLPAVAARMWARLGSDDTRRFEKLVPDECQPEKFDELGFEEMPAAALHRCIVAMLLAPECYANPYTHTPEAHPEGLMRMADVLGLDVGAMKRERLAEMKAATEPKPAAKKAPASKNTAAPKAAKKADAACEASAPAGTAPEVAPWPWPGDEAQRKVASVPLSARPPVGPGGMSPQAAWPFPEPKKQQATKTDQPLTSADGLHWVGQHVHIKGKKKRGEIRELPSDGTYLVGFETDQPGCLRLESYASHEITALPNQVNPHVTTQGAAA